MSIKFDFNAPPEKYSDHSWGTFVRAAVQFKAEPDTRAIISQIMPYFPKQCVVIAGFLNDADQFWKVNYHWELLLKRARMARDLQLAPANKLKIEGVINALLADAPTPSEGYTESKKVGLPVDASSAAQITKRWKTMRELKKTFRAVLDAEDIAKKNPPTTPWDLAAAPVAKPGTSKHGCGYAIDIFGAGQNELIKTVCRKLGATLTFDEKSHVHVEFKQGVVIAKPLVADDFSNGKWTGWLHGSGAAIS